MAQNILDLSLADFRATIDEMQANGSNTDEIVRQYRAQNSVFAPINNAADAYQRDLAGAGRRPVLGGLLSKEIGTTGMDALRSIDFEGMGGLLGMGQAIGQTLDAPAAAAQGLIPQADMSAEALGTAGLAMGAGGAVRRPAGSLGMGGRADELRRQANMQRFGYDPNDIADAPAPSQSGGFDNYLAAVNPGGRRIPAEDRPNLGMGDMYGMLPRGARQVSERDGVKFYQTKDGATYATAFNPDVGEMDVVGFSMPGGDSTELAVVSEMQGRGIGGELQYLARSQDPYAQTGGLTEAGEGSLRRTYERLRDDGIVSANSSASGGLLGAGLSEAQRVARDVLEMRAAGRAGEVTDDMMARADPQYMYDNTPLDMSVGARMQRKEAMGADPLTEFYHGTAGGGFVDTTDINAFDPSRVGDRWNADSRGFSITSSPQDANYYAKPNDPGYGLEGLRNDNLRGGMVYPLDDLSSKPYNIKPKDSYEGTIGTWDNRPENTYSKMDAAGADSARIYSDGVEMRVVMDPRNLRSRFARFDPEFSHLSNLSAANASPTAGLLASGAQEQDKPLPFMELLRGLLR
tara:strand:+ start:6827 stop:8551 length:1725 start_codon:yes stop_codon:yes gene_type:complete